MCDYLKIVNWERWQSYRQDRGAPPWIKVHRKLFSNVEWVSLSDKERGQLIAIWLLGAGTEGKVPADPVVLQRMCCMSDEPNLERLVSLGFLKGDVKLTPKRRQVDAPETETETETETDQSRTISSPSAPVSDGFERFWSVYPRRVGKRAALKAFRAAVKRGADPYAIVLAATDYAEYVAPTKEQRFIPHPSTWLNQDRFNDEPDIEISDADRAFDNIKQFTKGYDNGNGKSATMRADDTLAPKLLPEPAKGGERVRRGSDDAARRKA